MTPSPYNPSPAMDCLIPPHMVEAMKLRGDEEIKKFAARLERDSLRFRSERELATQQTALMNLPKIAFHASSPTPKHDVYDACNTSTLPGSLVRSAGSSPGSDSEVNDAYDGAGDVYDLYWKEFQRDSLDGHGMKLMSTVHYRKDYDNAFWSGKQIVYGDGGLVFRPLPSSLSIIGHELSHGVVQFSGGLIYSDQSGALNESFADIFGVLTEQRKNGQTAADGDWLVGKGLFLPGIGGEALRSLRAPGMAYDDPVLGKDPQPFHMDGYVHTSKDNGGVHINSGIPNHAFYILSQLLGGNAWELPGQIWYDTLQAVTDPHTNFESWADKTVEIARNRHGAGSLVATFTRRAWKLVGIDL